MTEQQKNHAEWLANDINTRIKKMGVLVSMNSPLHDEQITMLEGEIYEREQAMSALTGDSHECY